MWLPVNLGCYLLLFSKMTYHYGAYSQHSVGERLNEILIGLLCMSTTIGLKKLLLFEVIVTVKLLSVMQLVVRPSIYRYRCHYH